MIFLDTSFLVSDEIMVAISDTAYMKSTGGITMPEKRVFYCLNSRKSTIWIILL